MKRKFLLTKVSVLFLASIFNLSACEIVNKTDNQEVLKSSPDEKQKVSENNEAADKKDETEQGEPNAGLCTNKYFPVSDGAKWRYRASLGKTVDKHEYRLSYQKGADKFVQSQDINIGKESELKIEWLCFPEGLRTAQYGQLAGDPMVGMKIDSKGGTGITLPKDTDWEAGKKWSSEYDLGGTFDMKQIKGEVTGKAVLNHEILEMEDKINTSAGDFTAAKVKTNISLKITFQNRRLPDQNITMTNWYAPNVGLVRQEVTGTLGKMTMDYLGN